MKAKLKKRYIKRYGEYIRKHDGNFYYPEELFNTYFDFKPGVLDGWYYSTSIYNVVGNHLHIRINNLIIKKPPKRRPKYKKFLEKLAGL